MENQAKIREPLHASTPKPSLSMTSLSLSEQSFPSTLSTHSSKQKEPAQPGPSLKFQKVPLRFQPMHQPLLFPTHLHFQPVQYGWLYGKRPQQYGCHANQWSYQCFRQRLNRITLE